MYTTAWTRGIEESEPSSTMQTLAYRIQPPGRIHVGMKMTAGGGNWCNDEHGLR